MFATCSILKDIREEKGLPLQAVQSRTGIDLTQLCRIENGKRLPTEEQIQKLSAVYGIDNQKLHIHLMSDKILLAINKSADSQEALKMAVEKFKYKEKYLSIIQNDTLTNPIDIGSRRYIGSKAKLAPWIMDIIKKEARDAKSFFDVFAGTGIVSKQAISSFQNVIINDILFSNTIIYRAFFEIGKFDKKKIEKIITKYNTINPNELKENYFSKNFGNKYYDYDNAKLIGFIRQDIEDRRNSLSKKEYCVLLATLIYNIDRIANTVGHFEAYIKKEIRAQPLRLKLINEQQFASAKIYREDANLLARKIKADIAYIDPPYNSRQYCRFYHLYETLVKWDQPKLYGAALKPEPENMSEYCTCRATKAFEDLIQNLDVRYLFVSYNNTYNSKSKSSENKIQLGDIKHILESRGETKMYEQSHRFFNAGKTNFTDHKEYLFVTKVYNA